MSLIDDLTFFSVLAHSETLTSAGNKLGITPAAVTKRLQGLEGRLNVELLVRNTRRMQLTETGRIYAAGSRDILNRIFELENLVSNPREELEGNLSINCSYGFGQNILSSLLASFALQHPSLQISLRLTEEPLDLIKENCDLGIRIGVLRESRLHARKLFTNDRVICASPKYLKLLKSPIDTPEKLCNARIIGVAEDSEPANVWVLSSGEEMKSVKLFPVLSTNSSQVATQWALQGLGIMLRSNWAVKNFIESGCLVRVLPEWAMHSDGYAYYAMHRLSRNARAFLTYLISEIKLKEL